MTTHLTPALGSEKIFEGPMDGGCGARGGAISPRSSALAVKTKSTEEAGAAVEGA